MIVFANHVLHTTQAPTVFVNHVVPLQHTDTGRKTDFRRKVASKIGVTAQNSCYLALNQMQSPKLTPRQLRDKLPDSFNINQKLFQICKEDSMTMHTELRGQHTYMLNAKTKKQQEDVRKQAGDMVNTRETYAKLHTFRSLACMATLA